MSEIIRAAVWIPPSGAAVEAVNELMRAAQQTFSGPVFKPHVTLLSGIETTLADAETKLKKLAQAVTPFMIELDCIDWREEYFRALVITAALSEPLATAKAAAHTVFAMSLPGPFEPHLSLAYGNFDNTAREQFAQTIGKLDITFTADKLQLVNAAKGIPTREWQVLAEHRLAG